MRKDSLRNIKKMIKKEKILKGVILNPTLEECDYLYKYNIASTKSESKRNTLVGEYSYSVDTTDFSLE